MESGNAIQSNASVRLQYPRIWKAYSIGCLAFIIFMTVYATWFETFPNESKHTLYIIGPSLFALLALVLVLETVFTWYGVDEEGISIHGVLHRHRTIRWDEIKNIDTLQPYPSQDTNGFVINSDHGRFKLRSSFVGLPDFAVFVKRKLSEDKWRFAREMVYAYCPTRYQEQTSEWRSQCGNEDSFDNNRYEATASTGIKLKGKPGKANWNFVFRLSFVFLLLTLLVSQGQQESLGFYPVIAGIAVVMMVALIADYKAKRA